MPLATNGKHKMDESSGVVPVKILNPFVHKLEIDDPIEKFKVSRTVLYKL